MNARPKKVEEAVPKIGAEALSPTGLNSLLEEDLARVQQLAILAETTPEEMLILVLRDGFASCVASIRPAFKPTQTLQQDEALLTPRSWNRSEACWLRKTMARFHDQDPGTAEKIFQRMQKA